MKKIFSILAILAVMAANVFAIEPYIRATLTPGDAGHTECHDSDRGILDTEAAWGLGGGADILNFTENTVLGGDLGVKVHHLDFGYRANGQKEKDHKYAFDIELTPYIKYKTNAINFGAGPLIGFGFSHTKYDLDNANNPNNKTVDKKGFDVNAGGRIFVEVPFKNDRFAFVPAINFSRTIYTNQRNRLNDTTEKGWFCNDYKNGAKAWASFTLRCAL